jgi:hypothetical protein
VKSWFFSYLKEVIPINNNLNIIKKHWENGNLTTGEIAWLIKEVDKLKKDNLIWENNYNMLQKDHESLIKDYEEKINELRDVDVKNCIKLNRLEKDKQSLQYKVEAYEFALQSIVDIRNKTFKTECERIAEIALEGMKTK